MDTISQENTDDESNGRGEQKRLRAYKGTEKSDKEEKDRLRQESASKRKGRADRRRTEGRSSDSKTRCVRPGTYRKSDSDVSEEVNPPSMKTPVIKSAEPSTFPEPAPVPSPIPGTPPTSHSSTANTQKRTSRSNHKKGKGKNQYTKDRNTETEHSPARSVSRDAQRPTNATTSAHAKHTSDHKGSSKTKLGIAGRMSMLDMKRRVAAIMDFISRTQVDLAAEATLDRSNSSTNQHSQDPTTSPTDTPMSKDFKDLSCIEMMDVLTRDMVKWQNQYA